MTRTVELIVALVSKAEAPVAGAAGSALVIDQFNADMQGFELVNQSAQAGAAVAGVLSITSLTTGFVPFLNVSTNVLAGTTTFLKVVAHYKSSNEFKTGDVIALVGNVAGVVAGITLMAGFGSAGAFFAGVAIGANMLGIYHSDIGQNLYDNLVSSAAEFFHSNGSVDYSNYWVAPDLKVVSWRAIASDYASTIAVAHWSPETNAVVVGSLVFDSGDSGGSGNGGIVFGGGATHAGSVPELPDVLAKIDITIESLNGVVEAGPTVPPSTEADVDGDSTDRQDEYACCTGSQDGYH